MTLTPPTLRPLLSAEHHDAVTALSALLVELASTSLDSGASHSVGTMRPEDEGVRAILEQLSPPTDTIDLRPGSRRVA